MDKEFVEYPKLVDTHTNCFYHIADDIRNVEIFCERLNKLVEVNEQLREINKEIGDDLHNCRINKNIIREKLKLWQDVHKEYGIYNIKDFEESFKLDAKINKEKDEKIKELEVKVLNSELEKTNKAMYNGLKEQSEIIYQLIQKLKEHITEKELKELMEDCGL